MTQENFFDYSCDACGEMFCERVNLMNLALGFTEDAYCLACLAKDHERSEAVMADFCWGYVQGRDCFKDPWLKFDAAACPRLKDHTCYCQKP